MSFNINVKYILTILTHITIPYKILIKINLYQNGEKNRMGLCILL